MSLAPREINARDPRSTLQAIFRRWLSLSDAILRMVIRCMPAPSEAQTNRLSTLIEYKEYYRADRAVDSSLSTTTATATATATATTAATTASPYASSVVHRMCRVRSSVGACDTSADSDVVVFISKMMPVKVSELSARDATLFRERHMAAAATAAAAAAAAADGAVSTSSPSIMAATATAGSDEPPDEVFVALGRIFSGTLTRDSALYVLSSRHSPSAHLDALYGDKSGVKEDGDDEAVAGLTTIPSALADTCQRIPAGTIGLYACLGPSVMPIERASAGNIVALVGLDPYLLKTATLCSSWACDPLRAITFQARPMVRVAVEPKLHTDLPKLERGLKSLYQYDPAVEVGVDDAGQHIMSCLGELHLEQCVKSLTDKFAKYVF